ncbi:VOC family protein [Nocardioides hwasunensis]|uniref:VOC family protein n=1 Tax=Nocardioides hwasunensis TaxID=397258 RepID=A0ABR8MG25_9ACTN|nr:VOC family protein [Nocardioides hwasunensis]MBD3914515.1 VOC family protein [Nocardioides hwasunensis]
MSTRPGWIQVFLDTPSSAFEEAVAFWSAVTGWRPSERRGEDGQFLTLLPAAGSAYVKVQAVEATAGVHLDLDHEDRPAAIERARSLGATTAWVYEGVEVMRSPGGFTFCQTLLDVDPPGPELVRDGSTILDQVCLDIPAARWDAEIGFWRDLTGCELQQGSLPGFARLAAPGRVRILLQRLLEADETVRAHPDFASADRGSDTERHVGLGAEVVSVNAFWTALTAPGGQVYCLTDRDPTTGVVTPR